MTRPRARCALPLCLVALLALGACTGSRPPAATSRPDQIVVASFDFPESQVLAHIYGSALRSSGFRLRIQANAGSRELVDPALQRGLVDLVPEYLGSSLAFFSLGASSATFDVTGTRAALASAIAGRGLMPLTPSWAQDANAVVVTSATADRFGLQTISDLASVAGRLRFGGPPECPQRPLCLRGLRSVYGLRFERFFPLDTGGPLTRQALQSGEIDVGLLFTSDPLIAQPGLVVLADDRGLQPAENVTPVIRTTLVERFGARLTDAIDDVSASLTTEDLRTMNASLAEGASPAAVARDWLARVGLVAAT